MKIKFKLNIFKYYNVNISEICGRIHNNDNFIGNGQESNIIVPWAASVTRRSGVVPDKSFAALIVSPSLILASNET